MRLLSPFNHMSKFNNLCRYKRRGVEVRTAEGVSYMFSLTVSLFCFLCTHWIVLVWEEQNVEFIIKTHLGS